MTPTCPIYVWRVYNGATAACGVHRIVVAATEDAARKVALAAGFDAESVELACFADEGVIEKEYYLG